MNKYDVGIIGAGVAGAFAALRISQNNPGTKTIIFDFGRPPGKRRRQLEGWFGCFPAGDGKIYPNDLEKVLNLVDGRKARHASKWVFDVMAQANPMKLVKDTLPSAVLQKKIHNAGFTLQTNDHYQWKPESIHQLSKIISEDIEKPGNIDFSFDSDISLDSDGMPRLITSKSANNLAQGRLQALHGWKTKAQVKLDVMALALEELVKQERTAKEIEAELKQNQQQAEKLKGMLAKLKQQGK